MKALSSYVRNTTHFLSKIINLGDQPANCLFATLDVASLYTNIPNDQGIQAARETLETHRSNFEKPSTNNLMILLEKVLKMNNFDFANRHFLQIGGKAMGTTVASSFANTYMGWLESKFVYTYYEQPLLWVRFINDIFLSSGNMASQPSRSLRYIITNAFLLLNSRPIFLTPRYISWMSP